LLLVLAVPTAAHAFADASQFFVNSALPHAASLGASGEGIYFSGAPRFAGLACASCHIDAPGVVGLRLGADDPSLFDTGYKPGATYLLEVELTGETEGLQYNTPTCTDPPSEGDTFTYAQCNHNGFALEVDSANGAPLAGPALFCPVLPNAGMCPPPSPTSDETLVAPDGDAVFDNRVQSPDPTMPKGYLRNGATRWHFYWTAPKAGTGPLTIYAAGVDGNGGGGSAANDQDPYGDDTVNATFFVQEADLPVANRASAGCAFTARPAPPAAALLVAAALLWLRRRQRRES
jgi:MYXO-CTERM domain-containing protein